MNISFRQIWRVCLGITVFVVLILLAWQARQVLGWIAAGFFFAVALNPLVDWVTTFMPGRHRGLATGLVFIVLLSIIGFVIDSLVPPLIDQTQSLVRHLPDYISNVQNGHGALSDLFRKLDLVGKLQEQESNWLGSLTVAGGSLVGVLRAIFDSLAAIISILSLTYFMIVEGPKWVERFWSVQDPVHLSHRKHLAREMYKVMNGYVTGNIIAAVIIALATAVMLTITGVPYAIPLGLLTGVLDLLPVIGAILGTLVVCLVAVFTSITAGIVMLIFFLIYGQIETHALRPLVFGKSVNMSPLVVIMSILVGTVLDGIFGALIAIPVAACLQIVVKDWLTGHRPSELV